MVVEYEFTPSTTTNVQIESKSDNLTSRTNLNFANTEKISTVAITEIGEDLIVDVKEQENTLRKIYNHAAITRRRGQQQSI